MSDKYNDNGLSKEEASLVWKAAGKTFKQMNVGKFTTGSMFPDVLELTGMSYYNDANKVRHTKDILAGFVNSRIRKGLAVRTKDRDGRMTVYRKIFEKRQPVAKPQEVEPVKKDLREVPLDAVMVGNGILSAIDSLKEGIANRDAKIKELNEELSLFADDNEKLTRDVRNLQERLLEANNKMSSGRTIKLHDLHALREALPAQQARH